MKIATKSVYPAASPIVCAALLLSPVWLFAEPVPVRYTEGLVHGFLTLRALNGQILADGDLNQIARGDQVTSKLLFRFRDGSYHEETVVFSQRPNFRLVTDHVIQKGPSFPHPIDMSIDQQRQQVTVRYMDDDGKEKIADEHMDLPEDLANGLMSILLKNIPPSQAAMSVSMVAATPKPGWSSLRSLGRAKSHSPMAASLIRLRTSGESRTRRGIRRGCATRREAAAGQPCVDLRRRSACIS
jgi:hypothetical protein